MSRQLSLFPTGSVDGDEAPEPTPEAPAPSSVSSPAKISAPVTTASTEAAIEDRMCGVSTASEVEVSGEDDREVGLQVQLEALLDQPMDSLVLTDNLRRIISARPCRQGLAVRMHRCFTKADEPTLRAVAAFLNSRKGETRRAVALQVIRSYFHQHRSPGTATRRRSELRPVGRYYDLRKLRDRVNGEYFDGRLRVDITWGRAPRVRRRRNRGFSILLGSFTEQDALVRIHPCLDQSTVPECVVESVVYHEMLHADLPTEQQNGRRRLHTPEFRRREKLYRHFATANAWLEANLSRLAASR